MSDQRALPHHELALDVALSGLSPRIWRRLIVSEYLTLADLHEVLQIAMGWLNYHLYEFQLDEIHYTTMDDDAPPDAIDSSTVSLRDLGLSAVGSTLTYRYDFGDGWGHSIEVVAVHPTGSKPSHPRCVDGARCCPPEDCGGPYRYPKMLEILEDRAHPEHRELSEWVPRGFDPNHFVVAEINEELDDFFKTQVN